MSYALAGLLIWTVAGCTYFVRNLGYKQFAEPWYVKFLMPPVMVLALILGQVFRFQSWLRKRKLKKRQAVKMGRAQRRRWKPSLPE